MNAVTTIDEHANGAARKVVERTLPLDRDGRLSIDNHKGAITVTGWERDEVDVRSVVQAPSSLSDRSYARRTVEAVEVEIDGDERFCVVSSDTRKVPERKGLLGTSRTVPAVHHAVRLPRGARLVVNDHRSQIELRDLAAGLELSTHKGRVTGVNLAGGCWATTHKGEISLSCRGPLDLESHSGRLEVDWLEPAGESSWRSHGGDLVMRIPPGSPLTLRFNLGDRSTLRCPDLDGGEVGRIGRHRLRGGGPELFLETHKGRIDLQDLRTPPPEEG